MKFLKILQKRLLVKNKSRLDREKRSLTLCGRRIQNGGIYMSLFYNQEIASAMVWPRNDELSL